jgi:type I restriction enzyme S subunit
MRKYPKYKDSGVEWIGEIPEHWEMVKLKFLGKSLIGLSYQPEDVVDDETKGILVLRSSNIQDGKLSLEDNIYVTSKVKPEIVLKEGDILLCSRNGSRSLIGKNITITKELEGSTFGVFMTIFRTPYWEYLSKVFNSKIFTNQSGLFLTTTINQLTQDTLNNFVVPFIYDEFEKSEIVKFLDHKTSIIDELIGKTQRKIELLKDSIVNYLFYEKDESNIEIIQDIWFQRKPFRWKVLKFKEVFEVISDKNHPEERLLSVHQVKGVIYRDEQETDVMNPSGDISNYKLVQPEDFVISLRSFEGGFEFSEVRGLVSPVYTVLRPKFKIDSIYYKYLFKTPNFIIELNRYIKGIRDGKNINFSDIKDVPIPIPEEYDRIVHHIHQKIYDSFSSFNKKIDLLKEYRQSLISEVVTGKIDVRKN